MPPSADARATEPATAARPAALDLAWALKDLCQRSWGNDPPRSARAAAALGALPGVLRPPALSDAGQLELQGLVQWAGGMAALNRGEMAGAVAAFDEAAAKLRSVALPDAAAQTQVPKIMALSMLGQHDEAAACARAAQRELLALGNVGAAARVSQNLGNLLGRRDAYAEAAGHYREATVLFARLGEHALSVSADIGLAWCWASMGDFDEALRIYARAGMRAAHQGLALQGALVDESVALVALSQGRYRPALAHFESARSRYAGLGLPHCVAIAEKQLADAYLDLRLLPEALALYDTAVQQFQALALPDEQAAALAQRGRALALLGRGPQAEASLAEAAALFLAQDHPVGRASVDLARAELALQAGQPAQARAHAASGAAACASVGQADGPLQAAVLQAEAWLQEGQAAQAEAAFAAALDTARQRQQAHLQVRCLTGLGLCALALGRPGAGRAFLAEAIEGFEDLRRALPGDDLRRAVLTDHLRPYQALLRLALQDGDAAQVLVALDRCRARALAERLGEGSPAGDPDDAARTLRERLNWLTRRGQRLQEEGEDTSAVDSERQRTEAELLERVRRTRLAQGATVSQGGADAAALLDLPALQAALGPHDAVVAYGLLDEALFACVCTAQGVQLLRHLAPWAEVQAALQALHFQIGTLRHGAAPVQQHLAVLTQRALSRLQRLHAQLWAPLDAALKGCRRVLVVAQGALDGLPFGALQAPGDAQPLGERLQLSQAPSATLALRGLLRPAPTPRRVWALGESSRLPQAGHEAQAVAALFEQGHCSVGAAATAEALRRHGPEADLLHLACHAQFRQDNPRFSALHLVDGPYTVDDAEALGLKACTVVLSACETAMAEAGTGEEQLGLVRAFLVAGAARIVASLWPVDDAVTAQFMAAFYAQLRAGTTPAAALGHAQSVTRQHHPHPCFWGAFALHGGW